MVLLGLPKFGWLKMLKNSARKRRFNFFGHGKLTLQRKIGLPGPEPAQDIAPEISLLPSRRRSKCYWIESLAARILQTIQHKRHPRHHVRARHDGDAINKNLRTDDIDRRGRSRHHKTVERPVAEEGMGNLGRSRSREIVGHA